MNSLWSPRGDGSPVVKICGITGPQDALAAIRAGADALGFNFYPKSKRFLDFDSSIGWIRSLPRDAVKVAVVVNPEESLLKKLCDAEALDCVQFHGSESPEDCKKCPLPWIKALAVGGGTEKAITGFSCSTLLLDAPLLAGEYGGGGVSVDRGLAASLIARFPDRQFFLAGGLSPENVASAIQVAKPFGVDVASGVESAPGVKSRDAMNAFLQNVRNFQPA